MQEPSHDMNDSDRVEAVAMPQSYSDERSQWAGLPTDRTITDTLLKSFAGELGFRFYLLANMPVEPRQTLLDCTRLTNWPTEAGLAYAETGTFFDSVIVSHFKRSVLPISGGSQMFGAADNPADQARVSRLLGNFGIQATFAFTLHGPHGQQYLFAFSKRGSSPDVIGGDDTLSRGMKILDTLNDEAAPIAAANVQLSHRERECLEWCAAGKTAEETAIIMKLSAHTIESYIRSAMKKLGAVNRMQAIAKAIRMNAI